MASTFYAPFPWDEISPYADGKRGVVAVPYIGKGAKRILNLAERSVLVTAFTPDAVKAGQVDPREILAFIRRGVKVHSYDSLHAKVYVFGRTAFVGSANLSQRSKRVAEACIKTSEPSVVAAARAFVLDLMGDPVTPEQAKSLFDLYPKDGERLFGIPQNRKAEKTRSPRGRLWVQPVSSADFDEAQSEAKQKGTLEAKKKSSGDVRLKLDMSVMSSKAKVGRGDWIVWRWAKGRGYEFECPAKIIHLERVGKRNEVIVFAEKPKYTKNIGSPKVRNELESASEAFIYPRTGVRLVRSSEVDLKFRRLWSFFR